ncbi:MAG: BlaI/MecI/CopY family transcriptional regulator [Bryobacterales bacterium]|nr:BlaI/MecI/CopY family transcriptional regulator [Bryobacterales bacterium]
MPPNLHDHLSRRERQIMDVLYRGGNLTAAEIQRALLDPPGYSAVRALLRTLVEKGHIRHAQDGPRYVYFPVAARDRVAKSAVAHLLQTFFQGSPEKAVAALLDVSAGNVSDEEFSRLAEMIDRARKEGR